MKSDVYTEIELHHRMGYDDEGVVFYVSIGHVDTYDSFISFSLQEHVEECICTCKQSGDNRFLYDVGHDLAQYAQMMIDAADLISDATEEMV